MYLHHYKWFDDSDLRRLIGLRMLERKILCAEIVENKVNTFIFFKYVFNNLYILNRFK